MLRALSAPLRRGVGVVPSVSKLFTRQLSYPAHTVLGLPALSPTMTSGNVAKYLVSVGDEIQAGDRIAEIETDKATVDFDVVDGGFVAKILIPEGTSDVALGMQRMRTHLPAAKTLEWSLPLQNMPNCSH